MPGPAEQLLLAFGLDLSPLKQAANAISETLASLNRQSSATVQQSQSALAGQKTQIDQLKASLQEALGQEKLARAEAGAKLEQLKAQNVELRNAVAAQKEAASEARASISIESAKKAAIQTETEEAKKVLAERRAETAEIQKQVAEIRKKRLEEDKERKEGGEAGFASKVAGAVAGRGLAGSVAAGVLTGGGMVIAIDAAKEAIVGFIEKLREASVEGGMLVNVQHVFEGIAQAAGFNASEQIKKMQEATEGMVDKLVLLKNANALLSGQTKLSADQLVQLQHAVVVLAESSGISATDALDRMTHALGRGGEGLKRLGMQLPVLGGILRDLKPPPGLDEVAKSAWLAEHAFQAMIDRAKQMGELPDTIEKVATRLHTAQKDLVNDFAIGFNASPGTQVFLDFMNKLIDRMKDCGEAAEEFGRRFGIVLATLAPVVDVLVTTLQSVWSVIQALVSAVGSLVGGFGHLITAKDVVKAVGGAFLGLSVVIDAIGRGVVALINTMAVAAKQATDLGGIVVAAGNAMATGNLNALASAGKKMLGDMKQAPSEIKGAWTGAFAGFDTASTQKFTDYFKSIDQAFDKKKESKVEPIAKPVPFPEQAKPDTRSTELRLKLQEELNKLLLAQKQAQIAREKEMDDDAYHSAEESAEAHFAKERELAKRTMEARKEEIAQDLQAQIEDAKERRRTDPRFTAKDLDLTIQEKTVEAQVKGAGADKDYALAKQRIDKEEERNTLQVTTETIQKKLSLTKDGNAARLKEEEKAAEQAHKVESERIKSASTLLDKQFAAGKVAPADYTAQKGALTTEQTNADITVAATKTAAAIANANRERDAEIAAADSIFAAKMAAHQGENAAKTQSEAHTQAIQKAEEKVAAAIQSSRDAAELAAKQEKDRLAALKEGEAERSLKYVEHKYGPQQQNLETQQQISAMAPGGARVYEQTQLAQDMLTNLSSQQTALQQTLSIAEPYSDVWYQIQDRMSKVLEMQIQYNLQLAKMRDYTQPASELFSSIGSAIPTVFHSHFAANLGQTLGLGARSLQMGTQRSDQMVSAFDPNNFKDFSSGLQAATKGLTTAISAVSDFASTISNAKSAVSGGIGGAVGGAGMGQAFSGMLSKLSPSLGPFGALIGAAGGGIAGAITGGKQQQLTNNLNKLETDYKSIMNEFAQNTNNLQQTIGSLTSLIAQAQAMQAKTKKGGSQYTQLIQQYQQQLQQLQVQQTQVINQMKQQLASLSAPIGTSDFINQLQQIIQSYEQFAGAARNAEDLAQANQFLSQSLGGFVNTLEQQFGQDEQTAISDALQLNDALFQRQQLVYQMTQEQLQYNQQLQSILGQGTLTRQQTTAQRKGQEIEALTIQHNMQTEAEQRQLEQMNMQIQVSQYRVNAETQIFNLSHDRIQLEAELVQVQQAMAGTQLQNVKALSDFLSQIQQGNLGGLSSVSALLGALPSVTNSAAGLGASSQAIQNLFGQAYQDYSSRGYAGFTAANIG